MPYHDPDGIVKKNFSLEIVIRFGLNHSPQDELDSTLTQFTVLELQRERHPHRIANDSRIFLPQLLYDRRQQPGGARFRATHPHLTGRRIGTPRDLKGKRVMTNPSFTSLQVGVVAMMAKLRGWDFYEKLNKNDIVVVQGNEQALNMVKTGERPIAAGADHPAAR